MFGLKVFNKYIHSDHQALFVDMDLSSQLRAKLPPISRPDFCFMYSDNDKIFTFVYTAHQHLLENKVFHAYAKLLLDCNSSLTPWIQANQVDKMIGQAFQCVEAKCTHTLSHHVCLNYTVQANASIFGK